MGAEFDLDDVDHFTAGAVGEPGQRVFYLQAASGRQVVTLRCEKTQVAALAEYFAELLADLPAPADDDLPTEMGLRVPIEPDWVVGQIGVVFDEARDRMVVRAEELRIEDADPDDHTAGLARLALTRAQVHGFVVHAARLVAAGRPPCSLCGRPLDPEGHVCIKTNGHRKH